MGEEELGAMEAVGQWSHFNSGGKLRAPSVLNWIYSLKPIKFWCLFSELLVINI